MRLHYIANIRLPTEKAHGIQIMKTCEAFARAGQEAELIVPKRRTPIAEDAFAYYGVEKNFSITYLPVPDIVSWGPIGFGIETIFFAFAVLRHVREKDAVIYGRDHSALAFFIFFGCKNVIWESHTGAWNVTARYVARHAKALVTITKGLKAWYVARGVSEKKIVIVHDAVDLQAFSHPQNKVEARKRLGLPLEGKIVLYVGRLDGWKGVTTLCDAAEFLPQNYRVVLIGGEAQQVLQLQQHYPKVTFLGFHPYRELADNMAAADVLVLPNTGKDTIALHFSSPLKLFAYMTSGVPIVSSDLPSIREVVDDNAVFFVIPDDARALAQKIEEVFSNENVAINKSANAKERVRSYDWRARIEQILSIL